MALALMCFHQRPGVVGRYPVTVRLKDIPKMETLSDLNKLCDQDAFLELHSNSKRPVSNDWPNQGQSGATVLSRGTNIGLILGNPSGLLNVDLDCHEAKLLVDIILHHRWLHLIESRLIAVITCTRQQRLGLASRSPRLANPR